MDYYKLLLLTHVHAVSSSQTVSLFLFPQVNVCMMTCVQRSTRHHWSDSQILSVGTFSVHTESLILGGGPSWTICDITNSLEADPGPVCNLT